MKIPNAVFGINLDDIMEEMDIGQEGKYLQDCDTVLQQFLREKIVDEIERRVGCEIKYDRMVYDIRGAANTKILNGPHKGEEGTRIGNLDKYGRIKVIVNHCIHKYHKKDIEDIGQFDKQIEFFLKNEDLLNRVSKTTLEQFTKEMEGYVANAVKENETSGEFKAGDRIRMSEKANDRYMITKAGSEGIIERVVDSNQYIVKFTKIGGIQRDPGVKFPIERVYMQRVSTLTDIAAQNGGAENYARLVVKESVDKVISDMEKHNNEV